MRHLTYRATLSLFLVVLSASGQTLPAPYIEYCAFERGNRSIPIADYQPSSSHSNADVVITVTTARLFQTIEGFGGAFSEIGGEALSHLDTDMQQNVLSALFDYRSGAGFTFCRTPIGASDFALSAYSLNDTTNDYSMESFTIDRDRRYLIPYLMAALLINPALRLHACPWSPPGWLKTNGRMTGGGHLRDSSATYKSYATYLRRFVEAYNSAGIVIDRLFVQNEPNIEMKYPSCEMTPAQMVPFVVKYLAPEFRQAGLSTEIWAGSFQEKKDIFAHQCLLDPQFRSAVVGAGFQYSDVRMVQDVRLLYPLTRVMHTESQCFDGANTIEQAEALFQDISEYLGVGCSVFTYWNMILNEQQSSSWAWSQNSLLTLDRNSRSVIYNPDFAVMALVSRWVRPGAKRCEAFSSSQHRPLAFQNPDGSLVALLWSEVRSTTYQLKIDNAQTVVDLPANTLCAVILKSDRRSETAN